MSAAIAIAYDRGLLVGADSLTVAPKQFAAAPDIDTVTQIFTNSEKLYPISTHCILGIACNGLDSGLLATSINTIRDRLRGSTTTSIRRVAEVVISQFQAMSEYNPYGAVELFVVGFGLKDGRATRPKVYYVPSDFALVPEYGHTSVDARPIFADCIARKGLRFENLSLAAAQANLEVLMRFCKVVELSRPSLRFRVGGIIKQFAVTSEGIRALPSNLALAADVTEGDPL